MTTMWNDADLRRLVDSCKAAIRGGHRTIVMPPDRLALAFQELLEFRKIEDDLMTQAVEGKHG